jgi:hypothetical protein
MYLLRERYQMHTQFQLENLKEIDRFVYDDGSSVLEWNLTF